MVAAQQEVEKQKETGLEAENLQPECLNAINRHDAEKKTPLSEPRLDQQVPELAE